MCGWWGQLLNLWLHLGLIVAVGARRALDGAGGLHARGRRHGEVAVWRVVGGAGMAGENGARVVGGEAG